MEQYVDMGLAIRISRNPDLDPSIQIPSMQIKHLVEGHFRDFA